MTREERRDVYQAFTEVWTTKLGAMAIQNGERVQSSKGETGHGVWLDAAIDFFACAGDDRETLDRIHLCSVSDTRRRLTRDENLASRRFWKAVRLKRLDTVGMRIIMLMAA